MAADVNGQGAAFQVGAVRRLFEARFRTENYVGYGTGQVYQAAPDGKRFLVNVIDGDRSPTVPITVITAWTSMLTKDLP